MKVAIKDIYPYFPTLMDLANIKMPVRTGYRIAKAIRIIRPELETFEQARNKLIKDHGQEDESGNWSVLPEFKEKVGAEISILQAEEFEVDVVPVSVVEIQELDLSPMQIVALDFMLEGEL